MDQVLSSQPAQPHIERVEVTNTSAGGLDLRIHGSWQARQPLMLHVALRTGGEQLLSPHDVSINANGNDAIARFTITPELRVQVHDVLALQVGDQRLALPVSLRENLSVSGAAAIIEHPSMGLELKQLREERSGLETRVEELEQARRSAQLRNDAEWRRRIELERTVDQLRDERNDFEVRFHDAQTALVEERKRSELLQKKLLEEEAHRGMVERELHETKRSGAAEIERLERALEQRSQRYEQLHQELQALQSETATLRAQALRDSHDPSTLETLVAEVTGTATKLRERITELEAQRLEAQRGLTAAQTQLENEQRVRVEHEHSLRAEIEGQNRDLEERITALDRSLQQRFRDEREVLDSRFNGIEETLRALQTQFLQQPQQTFVAEKQSSQSLKTVLSQVTRRSDAVKKEEADIGGETNALIGDLTTAQERLKEQAQQKQEEPALNAQISRQKLRETKEGIQADLPSKIEPSNVLHTQSSMLVSGLAKPGDAADKTKLRARVVPASARRNTPWLRDSLAQLATEDQSAAERIFAGFLEAQLPRSRRPFRYGIVVNGGNSYCVSFAANRVHVHTCEPSETMKATKLGAQLDYVLAGPLQSLFWLAVGAAPRRLGALRDVAIQGRRRQVKRLLKTRHQPLNLANAMADNARLEPADLLRLFTVAIPTAWLGDERFVLEFKILGEQAQTVVLAVVDQSISLKESIPQANDMPITTISATAAGLRALLFRISPPMSETPTILGPREYAERWLEWVDQVQGIAKLP